MVAAAAAADAASVVIWEPHAGPQWDLLACPVFEVFYGGARGGGKTDGVLGDFASHADLYGEGAIGLMVRRERTQLIETIERSREMYAPLGAQFHESDKVWRFPNKARLRFAYLERDADAEAYQGHSYSRVYVEEIGNFPNPAPIRKLMATLRSARGVPVGFRATGNPGGPGHAWVKARYIDPAPQGYEIIRDEATGLERVYIPSRVSDNPTLMRSDPGYMGRIKASGSPELVRAWLEGDWSAIQGAYFPEFSMVRHVIAPRDLPKHWTRFRAGDWGTAKPFAWLWCAVSDGELAEFPRGAIIVYREWYGSTGEPNVGVKMDAVRVARGVADRTPQGEAITYSVLDPACFAFQGGPTIAETFALNGVPCRPADNARVGARGALGGWDQIRQRLVGDEDDRPMVYVFHTCAHLIRTLPALQHDQDRPEDVDTDGEDHAPDALRYACMSRPWVRVVEKPRKPEWELQRPLMEMVQSHINRRAEARDD